MKFLVVSSLLAATFASGCGSAPPPAPRPAETARPAPTEPAATTGMDALALEVRDPRVCRTAKRPRDLIAAEASQLEKLLAATSATSPDRPVLVRRLTNTLCEYETRTAGFEDGLSQAARRKQIDLLKTVVHGPKTDWSDEAQYALALEYELTKDVRSARAAYYEVIKLHPDSAYMPYAYLAWGELWFDELKAGDKSKAGNTIDAYTEALRYRSAGNPVYAYAFYRLGLVHRYLGDEARATQALSRAVDEARAHPDRAGASEVATRAKEAVGKSYVPSATYAIAEERDVGQRVAAGKPMIDDATRASLVAQANKLMAAPTGDYGFVAGSPQPSAYALVVGVEKYRDLPRASGASADANKFAAILRKTLGLREDHVVVATDERATRTDLLKHLEWLKTSVKPGGRAYVYFSGHGAPDAASGTAFMLPYDGDPKYVATTAIQIDDIVKTLGASQAQDALVVVDTCFSGAGGRSQLAKGTRPLVRIKEPAPVSKVAILSASSGSEISGPTSAGDEGLFTHHLADALGKAQADADGDGQVSLKEILDWVKPRVAREAKRDNRDQNPELRLGSGLRGPGDFIVGYGFAGR